jgi:hypothetical protein
MRRPVSVLIALVVMAAMLAALAAPALANHRGVFDNDEDCFFVDGFLICEDDFDGDFFDGGFFDNDEDCFFVDGFLICEDDFDGDFFDGDFDGFDFDGDFAREVEQDAESGDIDQNFSVTGTGDNSNQCVGTQGVANTGNAQDAVGLGLLGGDFDDFDIDDSGADIDVGGTNTTDCTSEVNQAASASG